MRAASMRFLEGKQPRFAHVPPSVRRSTMPTRPPSSFALIAAANAVEPEPRMRRSKGAVICRGPPSGRRDSPPRDVPVCKQAYGRPYYDDRGRMDTAKGLDRDQDMERDMVTESGSAGGPIQFI